MLHSITSNYLYPFPSVYFSVNGYFLFRSFSPFCTSTSSFTNLIRDFLQWYPSSFPFWTFFHLFAQNLFYRCPTLAMPEWILYIFFISIQICLNYIFCFSLIALFPSPTFVIFFPQTSLQFSFCIFAFLLWFLQNREYSRTLFQLHSLPHTG